MKKRWVDFIIGMNILAIGIVFNTKSMLGVGAINTLPYALSEIFGLSLGTLTTIVYIVLIVGQLMIQKKWEFKMIVQFPFSFVIGFIIDIYNALFQFQVSYIYQQYIILVFAILLTALGAFLMIEGNIVLNPPDGFVNVLSEYYHKPFGFVKNCFDIISILITVVVCLFLKGYVIGIGIGTVFSALFIGRCISIYQKIWHRKEGK